MDGFFFMDNPINLDDLAVPLFLETTISSVGFLVISDLLGICLEFD